MGSDRCTPCEATELAALTGTPDCIDEGLVDPSAEVGSQVLLNDFRRQWADVGEDLRLAMRRVGESGWYILGQEVQAFERELATFAGRKYVIGCGNGMDAIEICLRALDLQPGDRVLTTPLSAFATTLAIVRARGIPVFVDIDAYGLMDLERARLALQADKRIRFLVPVHLYGHALDLARLASLQREFSVDVIEDCCQAIGADWRQEPVGSVGAASAVSFYPTKNLGAMGDAGAVLTDDSKLDASSRSLRNYGQSSQYHHETLGLNSRLDELHAAMLRTALLPRLTAWTARRRAIAAAYLSNVANTHVTVPGAPPGSNSVWHLFPILVGKDQREPFRAHLQAARVASAIHYPQLISRQPALRSTPFEVFGSLSLSLEYCERVVSLPIHPYLSNVEVRRVISAVNSWRPS
jgi:dTDP-4-amino-4,6-dideoxygalactose transaminase